MRPSMLWKTISMRRGSPLRRPVVEMSIVCPRSSAASIAFFAGAMSSNLLSLDPSLYSAQAVAEAGQDGVKLMRAIHMAGVEAPFPLGQDERMALLAAECTMPARLVLEVDLAGALESSEEHEISCLLEGVETNELVVEDVGVVVGAEHFLDGFAALKA